MSREYAYHPVADAFRMMTNEELAELAEDIKVHGLLVAIVLLDNLILDGRNRYLACKKAGVEPTFVEYEGDTSTEALIAYVSGLNQHRRHDTVKERASAGVKLKKYYETSSRDRQVAGLKNSKNPENSSLVSRDTNGRSRAIAAAAVGVSEATIVRAEKVVTQGIPELVTAMEEGKVPIKTAASIASKPKAEQKAAVKEATAPRPSKNGREKNNPRPLSKLEDYVGRGCNLTDQANKVTPGGKFHRAVIDHLNNAIKSIKEWRNAIR